MSKIYQKMYPGNKNRSKSVLGGFIHNVILRRFYSESHPYSSVSEGLSSLLVISKGCNWEFQPYNTAQRLGCRVKTSRHDGVFINRLKCQVKTPGYNGNINNVILRSCNSGSHPYSVKRAGFTLIELLVVVLIIGILAAIALPQYERSVEKSRSAEALLLFDALEKAERLYYLSNGRYTRNLEQLDIQIPDIGRNIGYGQNNWTTDNFYYWVDAEGFGWNSGVFKAKAQSLNKKYKLYLELNGKKEKIIWCGPYVSDNWPARPAEADIPDICKVISGRSDGIIYKG